MLAQILHQLPAPGSWGSNKVGVAVWASIYQSAKQLPHQRSTVCTPLGESKTPLLAIGHAAGNLFSEDGRRIFICARQTFGGGRCPWDSETDNHV